ncbi:Uncharacterised protein [Segatella copri]|nr:Uncharacterised protein [Segatella copri]
MPKEMNFSPSLLCFSSAELLMVPHAVTLHLIIFLLFYMFI